MNTTFPILSKLVKNIEPQELSGGKFTSIEVAREVAKKCQKSKSKLMALEDTAKVLGVEKAFYTMIKDQHVLFIIDGENAYIEILPNKHDIIYHCYQVVSEVWRWWSMGAHLSIMLKSLKTLGAKKFQFNSDFIIGIQDEETIYCLSTKSYDNKDVGNYLPNIPKKKLVPPFLPIPVVENELEGEQKETKDEKPGEQLKSKRKPRKTKKSK